MATDQVEATPLALIIEDDAELSEIFAQAIHLSGFTVELINDGGQALERLAVVAPMLVLLDMQLPHVSGEKILRYIRADERLAATRVIVATANDRMAEELRKDSDLVLLKPISFNQLQAFATRLRSNN
jgi:DNA-binding response OmpR family regulator